MSKGVSRGSGLWVFLAILALAYGITKMPALGGLSQEARYMLGITFVAIACWVTECISIPLTGIVIIFLQSVLGVLPLSQGLSYVASKVNVLIFAGLVISIALSKYQLDRLLSLKMVSLVGDRIDRIVLAMMMATSLLSMWVPNTAAAAIMVPIAFGILNLVEARPGESELGKAMMIGIAYAASIGGMGTPVGTPPSSVTIGFLKELAGIEVTFLQWMARGVPVSLAMTLIAWKLLLLLFKPEVSRIEGGREIVEAELSKMGKLTGKQTQTLLLFAVSVVLWLMDSFLPVLKDWMYLASMLIVIAFLLPGVGVLSWREVSKEADWGVLFLVAGGLALGGGLSKVGLIGLLSKWVGGWLSGLNPNVVAALMVLIVSFSILVFCSVTATSSAFVPIAIGIALELGIEPRLLGMAAGFASCFAFFLPANTPPNAIAYSYGYFKNYEMAKSGFLLTVMGALLLMLLGPILW